jgi:hypothetical protein
VRDRIVARLARIPIKLPHYSRHLVCFAVLLLSPSLRAQQRHDPLNSNEIDQLRDAAQDPDERLKLFVQFARARLAAIEQVRADPKVTDRAQQTHDRLQDFLDVYDELNDNLDTFVERKADLRHALKGIIEADTEFQAKLRALKTSVESSTETKQYDFMLNNALDAVDEGAQDHRQLLAEQEEAAKRKKK